MAYDYYRLNNNQGRARGMINKKIFQDICSKEMDRKDFLKYFGLSLLTLVGFRTFATLLSQSNQKIASVDNQKQVSNGFGSGKYGG